jgi:hypothetical protein
MTRVTVRAVRSDNVVRVTPFQRTRTEPQVEHVRATTHSRRTLIRAEVRVAFAFVLVDRVP